MLRALTPVARGPDGHTSHTRLDTSKGPASTLELINPSPKNAPIRTAGLFADEAFSSRRQLHLHTYDAHAHPKKYVEVKIGGHPLDHRLLLEAESQRVRPHGPLKTHPRLFGSNQSLAYEARERPALVYSPVKIGGHALDHVRFFDKGLPSRPLWGFVPASPPIVVFSGRRPQVVGPQSAAVPRNLLNLYACGHCRRMRQSPRVQLCCGHALCSSCLSSDSVHHIVLPSSSSTPSSCLLECVQCDDFVAMTAVVFPPDRILHVGHDVSARTLRQLRQQPGRADDAATSPRSLPWSSGGTLAALIAATATATVRMTSPRTRKMRKELPATTVDEASPVPVAIAVTGEDGAARWQKRVRGVQDPSASRLATYSFERTLGVGNFAEVMLVRDRKGTLCVLKESDKLREAVNEMALLSKVRSAHVVRIHTYFVEEIAHRPFAYIAMEYCDRGDLGQRLVREGAMNAATFDDVFRQLCLGLQEIHAHGIVHRDLKPGNVLLTSEGLVKIADFGVSTCLESTLLTHHAAGTVAFMAPEVRRFFLGEDVGYDTKADIWSLGALAVAMLSGNPEPRVATRIADEVVDELVETHGLSDRHAALLRTTLDADPHKRPTLTELLEMVPPMSARL